MKQTPMELWEEQIEQRLLQALTWSDVLPYADLKMQAAANVDDATFRRVLNKLIACGLVQRRTARKGLWYHGYAKAPANHESILDDIPAPLRKFLNELVW